MAEHIRPDNIWFNRETRTRFGGAPIATFFLATSIGGVMIAVSFGHRAPDDEAWLWELGGWTVAIISFLVSMRGTYRHFFETTPEQREARRLFRGFAVAMWGVTVAFLGFIAMWLDPAIGPVLSESGWLAWAGLATIVAGFVIAVIGSVMHIVLTAEAYQRKGDGPK